MDKQTFENKIRELIAGLAEKIVEEEPRNSVDSSVFVLESLTRALAASRGSNIPVQK